MSEKVVDRETRHESNPLPGPSYITVETLDDGRTKTGVGDTKSESEKNASRAFSRRD